MPFMKAVYRKSHFCTDTILSWCGMCTASASATDAAHCAEISPKLPQSACLYIV